MDDDWAASGAMALTGRADGPPLRAPGDPAGAVRRELDGIRAHAPHADLPDVRLLGERAALLGLSRRGPWSAGGAFRLLPTLDGRHLGVSLARESDVDLLPALLAADVPPDAAVWDVVARWAAVTDAVDARERAHLLGIPAAVVPEVPEVGRGTAAPATASPVVTVPLGASRTGPAPRRPLVVDLSSLWAGPLCAHLLGRSGMRIVKVESIRRPDGARRGSPAFYDLLHTGHASVALDFTTAPGRTALRALLTHADIVVEASRPRALTQLGITPHDIAAARPGLTWVSVTAYGRTGPWADRPGLGDDVAAAVGLVARDAAGPVPCGDALADPLTGVHAAHAALVAHAHGGGVLLDVAMYAVCRAALHLPSPPVHDAPAPPCARPSAGRAPALGADTAAVLRDLGIPCP